MDINNLVINGCNCFNCKHSHLFNYELKCGLKAQNSDGSDYILVNEDDIRMCWEE